MSLSSRIVGMERHSLIPFLGRIRHLLLHIINPALTMLKPINAQPTTIFHSGDTPHTDDEDAYLSLHCHWHFPQARRPLILIYRAKESFHGNLVGFLLTRSWTGPRSRVRTFVYE